MINRINGKHEGYACSTMRWVGLAAISVTLAFAQSSAALAQQTDDELAQKSGDEMVLEMVNVTGSRVALTDGTRTPTPVTVISDEQLQLAAPTTITEALLQLPAFAGSVSVANQSTGTTRNNGAAYLNLRDLGTERTLVLLDGRRIVSSSSAGSVDVALIPEALIKRVDIVTGGASAAYGSDAVAGVVNYVIDNDFSGFKASLLGGTSQHGGYDNYKITLAGGHAFIDERLKLVGSVEYYDNNGVDEANMRDWAYRGRGYINNPNVSATNPASPYNPKRLLVVNPLSSIASNGGLIIDTALAGTTFHPGGNPQPFQYGALRSASQMQGSSDPTAYNPNLELTLQPEQQRQIAFGHAHFDVTDTFGVFAEITFAQNDVRYKSLPTFELSQTAFTIFSDNAFLPASISDQMTDLDIDSMTVGRVSSDIAIPTMVGKSKTERFVVGLDGSIGSSWTYNGYYQYGENESLFRTINDPISNNLYRAADSVLRPGTNDIVCRSTLTNPSDGCQPLNIFGFGSPSQAAIDYVNGTAVQDVTVKQNVAEISFQGTIIDLPAGPLGVAVGAGYRKEEMVQYVDPISSSIRTGDGIMGFPAGLVNTLGGFERSNPQPTAGEYDVTEIFTEGNFPLLTDTRFARALTLNAAVRSTDYSTSGRVTTWKAGIVYEPFDGLLFRATRSRDIRAPSLGELFRGSSQGTSTVTDPFRGDEQRNALTGAIGNPLLEPEIADTTVVGFVVQPASLEGLSISVDYYDISVDESITALAAQRTVDLCFEGAIALCSFIQRDDEGRISRVELPYFNVDLHKVEGVDFEASYSMPVGEGLLGLRLLTNYEIADITEVAGTEEHDSSSELGQMKGVLSANFDFDRATIYLQERYVGGGDFDSNLGPVDVDKNHQDAVWYTDATFQYRFGKDERTQLFFTINNLFDKNPPLTPSYLIAGSAYGNRTLYDMIGRRFTLGVRMEL